MTDSEQALVRECGVQRARAEQAEARVEATREALKQLVNVIATTFFPIDTAAKLEPHLRHARDALQSPSAPTGGEKDSSPGAPGAAADEVRRQRGEPPLYPDSNPAATASGSTGPLAASEDGRRNGVAPSRGDSGLPSGTGDPPQPEQVVTHEWPYIVTHQMARDIIGKRIESNDARAAMLRYTKLAEDQIARYADEHAKLQTALAEAEAERDDARNRLDELGKLFREGREKADSWRTQFRASLVGAIELMDAAGPAFEANPSPPLPGGKGTDYVTRAELAELFRSVGSGHEGTPGLLRLAQRLDEKAGK